MKLPEHKQKLLIMGYSMPLSECSDDCPRCAVDKILEIIRAKKKFYEGEKNILLQSCYVPETLTKYKSKIKVLDELLKEIENAS